MASENEIVLRVKADIAGLEDVNQQFRALQAGAKDADYQFRQGKISGEQLKSTLAGLANEGKKLNLSYKQQVDLNASLQQVTWRAQAGFKSLALSLQDIQQAIGGRGAAGLMSSIPNLTQNFLALRMSTGSTALAFQAMGSTLLGPAGIVMAVTLLTTAIVSFISSSKEEKKAVEDVKDALKAQKELREQIFQLKHDLGIVNDEEYRAEMTQQLNLLQVELERLDIIERISKARTRSIVGPDGKPIDLSPGGVIAGTRTLATAAAVGTGRPTGNLSDGAVDNATKILEVQKKMLEIRKSFNAEDKRGRGGEFLDSDMARMSGNQARARGQLLARLMRGRGAEARAETFGEDGEAKKGFDSFRDSVLAGTNTMIGSVGTLGTAFANVFGGAKTMLGSFAGQFADTMQRLASQYAIGALFSFIGGPFAAVGATLMGRAGGGPISAGRPYVVGEHGPELFFPRIGGQVMSHSKSLQYARRNETPERIVIVSSVKGDDLVFSTDRARQRQSVRKYGKMR